jgi:hypothetical protein
MKQKLGIIAVMALLSGSAYGVTCWCTANATCIASIWCGGQQCSFANQVQGFTIATTCARGQPSTAQGESNMCNYKCPDLSKCSAFKSYYAIGTSCP